MVSSPFSGRPLWLSHTGWDRAGHVRLHASSLRDAVQAEASWVADVRGQSVRLHEDQLAKRPLNSDDAEGLLVWAGLDAHGAAGWVRVHEVTTEDSPWTPWREAALVLGDDDAVVMATGLALGRWHALSRFCGRCGAATVVAAGGWVRRCPDCELELYPRTDPVVIMAVIDADDRICLARGHRWTSAVGMSCPAGFVDAAESLEDAVRREVAEELGLTVTEVSYAGSQPWPSAGQLMVAMTARVEDPTLTIDPAEVVAARWYTREELHEALQAKELTLPASFAAGRWLVERWLGETLPEWVSTAPIRPPAE